MGHPLSLDNRCPAAHECVPSHICFIAFCCLYTGAGIGAGGASIYFTGLGDSLRYVLDHGMGFTRGSGGATMADKHYDELYRMVQQLSTEMGRRQQGITIVHGADSKCVCRFQSMF